jgi:hypothetical protein
MQVKEQVVIMTADGQEITQEVACREGHDLTPVTLGLARAVGKAVLQALQAVVVEWQMEASLRQQRTCPQCGKTRRRKGMHHPVLRPVFGVLSVESPRLSHGAGQAPAMTTFSPLATLLPERIPPALLFVETQGAALVSYGLTSTLRQDVLPLDEPLQAVTIRNHVLTVTERLEDALGEAQWSFIDRWPAAWAALPMPHGPITVGIAGGYVKAQGEQGWFEVIAGKSLLAFTRGAASEAPSPVRAAPSSRPMTRSRNAASLKCFNRQVTSSISRAPFCPMAGTPDASSSSTSTRRPSISWTGFMSRSACPCCNKPRQVCRRRRRMTRARMRSVRP